ncbi:hypothetical protein [Hyphomicrobium facile]|uniref:Uncharacterized protein n=1 Tax=Hyphomicrobium facile TaxID=51670 RepID=A0A1I7NRP1_9HYPH|nr:hypothetical protein [Hyphomicrobium facile]SFV37270.1 hypothetical protein SAMN04488557_3078 [Hyphomicrobium facile]
MVTNTDTIARLIASDTLMRGERQLLRNQTPVPQEAGDDAARTVAPPISHNDKTMAPVLLTLLDEQLGASVAPDANRAAARGQDAPSAPNRIAARYAEDDTVFRADLPANGTALPPGQNYPQIAQTVSSLDLQTFMQRFLMGKVRSIPADGRSTPGGARGPKSDDASQPSLATAKFAAIAVVAVMALVVVAVRFFG